MKKISLAIYDFDKTLYRGDCSIDFYLFCLKKYPYKIWHCLGIFFLAFFWKSKILSTTKFKQYFFSITNWANKDADVAAFWDIHGVKIFPWVKGILKADIKKGYQVVCISASPEFLLGEMARRLDIKTLMGTRFHHQKIKGKNCKGQEKVNRLNRLAKKNGVEFTIHKMTSDSMDDLPLYKIAMANWNVDRNGIVSKGLPK